MSDRFLRHFGSSRTLLVLRLAMTVAWAWIAVGTLLSPRLRGPLAISLGVLGFASFLVALWAALHRAPRPRATPGTLALLGVQLVSGLAMATDLMLLVAMELPLVMRPRQAAIAFASLLAVVVAIGLALARAGTFVAAPELAGMPQPLQVGLTLGSIAGWQVLAFAGGLLAATEIRARRDVTRLMSQLRIANGLIAETSREAERLHIARELHDAVGHRLAALGVSLDLESRRAEGASATSLREARDATQQLLAEVREVVGAMRQERAPDLKRAIAALVGAIESPEVELRLSPGLEARDAATAHALYRCAQEALTNVLRHAQAGRARVELHEHAGVVTLRVHDDGEGARAPREGHGLAGMRERIEALGGSLRAGPAPGGGFEVEARVPVRGGAR